MRDYSDNGEIYHAAYGYRWRKAFGADQLEQLVAMLKADPTTRRAVLTVWEPTRDLGVESRDLGCNTQAYFKLRDSTLRMTVCCRSNDILWGAYGANAVHWSTLQEYMACKLGAEVGAMTTLSDSWHVYTGGAGGLRKAQDPALPGDLYAAGVAHAYALGAQDDAWDEDLRTFFARWDADGQPLLGDAYHTPYFRHVVVPLWTAFTEHRQKNPTGALDAATECRATDWRTAAQAWLERRARP
jgi:hypothetical protein